MSKTLTITDDRVREAASTCADAARALKILFPDVFTPKVGADLPDPRKLAMMRGGGSEPCIGVPGECVLLSYTDYEPGRCFYTGGFIATTIPHLFDSEKQIGTYIILTRIERGK